MLFACAPGFGAEVTFALTDAKGQPVGDAVVSLLPLDAPAPAPTSIPAVEVEQKGQEFSPYVTAVRVGTTVKFPNRDAIEHHVYSESAARRFEFPLYKPGTSESITFNQPGVVSIGCNIHDWMMAHIVVLPTPWFAVVGSSGRATVAAVPAGRYRAEVWHPRLVKPDTREVTVGAAAADPLAFRLNLKPDRRIRRVPEAGGKGYR